MRRRELLALLTGVALVWPLAVSAQEKAIGWLGIGVSGDSPTVRLLSAFREGLGDEGYVEGKSFRFDYRWAKGHDDRLPALAASLVADRVDLMVAAGSLPVALAAKAATTTVPIVFATGADPVAEGLVASLARPGANLTGVAAEQIELSGKRVQLLTELVPQAKTIAVLVDPNYGAAKSAGQWIAGWRQVASGRGLQLRVLQVGSESELGTAFASLARLRADALMVAPYPSFGGWRKQITTLARRYKVPTIYYGRLFVASGGLISYGPSLTAMFRLAGQYAGRILKGAKPADLPVQQPTGYELVVNLKTAKTIGLTMPPSILARADEVIE